ncbi:MAG: T9SS type A sorting domain-containing protein [Saprospiraceae bacterium]|nr:T9SS type A sorting domain-containing protein [Saprospiraceae bacterium]
MNTPFLPPMVTRLLVAFLFLFSYSNSYNQIIFDETFGVGAGLAIKATADNGYLMIADNGTALENIKLNQYGQLATRHTLDVWLDKTIPVEGAVLTAGGLNDKVSVRKTSLNNAVFFDSTFTFPYPNMHVNDICELQDEGYVIAGNFQFLKEMVYQGDTFDIDVRRVFLLRLDKQGRQIFFEIYNDEPDVNDNATPNRIIERADGSFLVAAGRIMRDINPSPNAVIGIVMHFSSTGQLLQEIATPFVSNYYNYVSIPGLINTADGGFAIGGMEGYIANRCIPIVCNVVKYDQQNNKLWDIRTVSAPGSLQLPHNYLFDIAETPQQNIVVLGLTPPGFCNPTGSPARMHLYDENGVNIANYNEPPLVDFYSSGSPVLGKVDITPTLDGKLVLTATKNGDIHAYKFGEELFSDIKPDLELQSRAIQAQPAIYSNFAVEFMIENRGMADANNIKVNLPLPANLVYVGGDEATTTTGTFVPYSIDEWRIPILHPGERHFLTVNYFNLSLQAKTIYAQVTAQDELDMDSQPNNGTCCTPVEDDETVVVINAGSNVLPDIYTNVNAVAASGPPGFYTSVLYEIANLTGINIPVNTTSALYFSINDVLDGNDQLLSTNTEDPLGPNASYQNNLWYTVPSGYTPGNYYLILKVDNGDIVTEANESNNLFIMPFQLLGSPDLSWTGINFLPDELGLGAAFNTDVQFTNSGNAAAGNFNISIFLSQDDQLDAGQDLLMDHYRIFGLNPGSIGTTSFRRQEIPSNIAPGNYYLLFQIDADDEVAEPVESNNILAAPLLIIQTGKPDLIHKDLNRVGTTLLAGDFIEPEVAFSVEGSKDITSPFSFGIYLSNDNQLDGNDILIGQELSLASYIIHYGYAKGLAPMQIPPNTATGDYYIISKLDNQDVLSEENESNNIGSIQVHIDGIPQPGVDLELSLSGPANNPPNFSFFNTLAKLENKGTATAYNIVIKMPHAEGAVYEGGNEYYTNKGTYDLYGTQSWRISSLAPGEVAVLSMNFFRLSPQLVYQFGYVVVADGQDIDSNPGYVPCCVATEDDEAYLELPPNYNTQLVNRNIAFESSPIEITLLEKVYPNPATEETNVLIVSKEATESIMEVFDALGNTKYRESIILQAGVNQVRLDIQNWPAGIYQIMLHPFHPYLRKAQLMVVGE